MEPIKILCNLDDLYDTRYSMLCSKGIPRAVRALELGYATRKDESPIHDALGIDADGWDRLYKKRDNNILRRSIRSKMYNLLITTIEDASMTPRSYVDASNVEITVNEFPYALGPKAKDEQVRIMRHYLGPIKVRWISKPTKRLTPRYLTTNFTHCFMYNWNEWVLLQEDAPDTEMASLLNLTFVLPAVLRNKPDPGDINAYQEQISGKPIHEMLEYAMSPGYTIRFQSVEYWNFPMDIDPMTPSE